MRKLCYFLLVTLVAVIVVLWLNHVKTTEALREAQEEVARYKVEYEHAITQIVQLEKQNSELRSLGYNHIEKIKELDAKIKEQADIIADLEANQPPTPPGCEEVVAYYRKEIEAWKYQFSLAQKKINELEQLNANLKLQIQNQDEIIDRLKKQLERANSLLDAQVELMKEINRDIFLQKKEKKIITASAAILTGMVIYTILKK